MTDPRFSSSTTLEVLGGLWLRDTLIRIERKVDVLLKAGVSPDQLIKLTQAVDESKSKSDALAEAIEENK